MTMRSMLTPAPQAEMLLHCTKCNSSCHPTCVGLHLDLVNYVTAYNWECTDCKQCMTCQVNTMSASSQNCVHNRKSNVILGVLQW